jgi:predicted membrane channel-forming protein YqfA (hemolysin III family)
MCRFAASAAEHLSIARYLLLAWSGVVASRPIGTRL